MPEIKTYPPEAAGKIIIENLSQDPTAMLTGTDKLNTAARELTPLMRMHEQLGYLDRALNTIDGWSDESERARSFIVGQIEMLKWCLKQLDGR